MNRLPVVAERDETSDLTIPPPELKKRAAAHPALIEEEIADREQYRQLRAFSFYGVAGLIATLATLFVAWTASFGMKLHESFRADPALSVFLLTPMIVMSASVVLPLLALVRFVFRDASSDDEPASPTLWQALLKELADLLKQYLNRSRPAT
ncbi:hypothetical protein [Caballeronia sp. LZ043]|uniref:hypothetical protein n=1 Tax=Caballeronia sp. LZ043 TaxID=3038569 RepID=UPI00285FC3E9|nr:hypothetical protein [Caballeronia sp. LZ043]MDR5820765.1 hypothetical protein [Caballeronia sp. LZ043]